MASLYDISLQNFNPILRGTDQHRDLVMLQQPGYESYRAMTLMMRDLKSQRYMKHPNIVKFYLPLFVRKLDKDGSPCVSELALHDYDNYVKLTPFVPYTHKLIRSLGSIINTIAPSYRMNGKPIPESKDYKDIKKQIEKIRNLASTEFMTTGRIGLRENSDGTLTLIPSENILDLSEDFDFATIYECKYKAGYFKVTLTQYEIREGLTYERSVSYEVQNGTAMSDQFSDRYHLYGEIEIPTQYNMQGANWSKWKPVVRGNKNIGKIPITFILSSPTMDEPPLYSIGHLNVQLFIERNRYTISKNVVNSVVYSISQDFSNRTESAHIVSNQAVWYTGKDTNTSVLQPHANGLKYYQDDIKALEEDIALMSSQALLTKDSFKNSDGSSVRGRKELLDLTSTDYLFEKLERGFERAFRNLMSLNPKISQKRSKFTLKLNNIVTVNSVTAKDMVALIELYNRGLLSLEDFYVILYNSDWLAADLTFETFKANVEENPFYIRSLEKLDEERNNARQVESTTVKVPDPAKKTAEKPKEATKPYIVSDTKTKN